jgi:hypothetical protein
MGDLPPNVHEPYPVEKSDRSDGQVLDRRRGGGPSGKVLRAFRPGGGSMGKSSSHGPAIMEGVREGWNSQAQIAYQC